MVNRLTEIGIDGFNNQLKPTFEAGHSVWYFRGYKYAGVAEDGSALYYDKNGKVTQLQPMRTSRIWVQVFLSLPMVSPINLAYKGIRLLCIRYRCSRQQDLQLMVSADRPLINGITTYWENS